MYTAGSPVVPPMIHVGTMGWGPMASAAEAYLAGYPSSVAFQSANSVYYHPIMVQATCVVRRLWWANGSTVSASYNVDVGIYRDAGYKPSTKLISSGSTAQGTASQVQFVDITDTTLAPGLIWIAIACSSVSATFLTYSLQTTGGADAIAMFYEYNASIPPLPATATTYQNSSQRAIVFGIATTASP